MDGMEIKISNFDMEKIPFLLQLLPSEPESNSRRSSNQTQSHERIYGSDVRSSDPERDESPVQLSNWLSLGSSSMGGMEKQRLEMSGSFENRIVGSEISAVGVDNSQLRILYVPNNPTMRITCLQLFNHNKLSYITFLHAIVEHIRRTNSIENALCLEKIIDRTLKCFEIHVWDFFRFLTKDSSVNCSPISIILRNNPSEEIVFSQPTLKNKQPESLTATVVAFSDGSTDIPALCLCRVRIIFALPQEIYGALPSAVQSTSYIPFRLAFVEWYSLARSPESKFYEISPMMSADTQPICGVISVTDIKGSVPMFPKMSGMGKCKTFLVDATSVQAVACAKCQFDLLGKNFRSLLRTVN